MDETAPAHRFTYRFERCDFIAWTRAAVPRLWRYGVIVAAIWLVFALADVMAVRLGFAPAVKKGLRLIAFDALPVWIAVVVLLAMNNRFAGMTAGRIFKNNACADQEIDILLRPSGIVSSMPGLTSQFDWTALKRIIETETHLFLAISKREALIIPRRAFAGDGDYQSVRDFILRHVGGAVPLSRQ